MARRAKIVGTIGPSSSDVETLKELIQAGLNVARINMSHGTHENHRKTIENIRQVSKEVGQEVAVLLDLQGPKIRVDKLKENLTLKEGDFWHIGNSEYANDFKSNFIPTIYKNLVSDCQVGAQILFDDGHLEAKVVEKNDKALKVEVIVGGVLKSNKGINLPNVEVSAPSMTEKDHEDLLFGLKQDVDYVALSFVRSADDIKKLQQLMHQMKTNIPVVSKIEKPEAIENIDEIIEATDVIMVARGDMGVEVGNHHVPSMQKMIINKCNETGVPVITATQMLESMVENPRPTRAEASDVANAIWDGTDAVMLSGETAAGKYPVQTVKTMSSIIEEAEKTPKERPLLRHIDLHSITSANQVAASMVSEKVAAKWILAITERGNSCLKMSRFRPKKNVLGVTNNIRTIRKMCLYWGITPFFLESDTDDIANLDQLMIDRLIKDQMVEKGDKVVITHGDGSYFRKNTSNSIRVEIIKNDGSKKKGEHLDIARFDRGRIILDTDVCSSCQNCLTVCPHNIWVLTTERKEVRINHEEASSCALDMACVERCPTGAIEIIQKFDG